MNVNFKKLSILPFIVIVKFYKIAISPWLGNNCRFQPTCSSYMIEALQTFGLFKGFLMGMKRILSCHPWGRSGYDPVIKQKD